MFNILYVMISIYNITIRAHSKEFNFGLIQLRVTENIKTDPVTKEQLSEYCSSQPI